jgi:hypothetical protein
MFGHRHARLHRSARIFRRALRVFGLEYSEYALEHHRAIRNRPGLEVAQHGERAARESGYLSTGKADTVARSA